MTKKPEKREIDEMTCGGCNPDYNRGRNDGIDEFQAYHNYEMGKLRKEIEKDKLQEISLERIKNMEWNGNPNHFKKNIAIAISQAIVDYLHSQERKKEEKSSPFIANLKKADKEYKEFLNNNKPIKQENRCKYYKIKDGLKHFCTKHQQLIAGWGLTCERCPDKQENKD